MMVSKSTPLPCTVVPGSPTRTTAWQPLVQSSACASRASKSTILRPLQRPCLALPACGRRCYTLMARRYDESDVRVRPGKGSRPRTKDRPTHDDAKFGMVITKDRGRWGVALDDGPTIVAMRAREMGRTPVEVGDRVGVVGDT